MTAKTKSVSKVRGNYIMRFIFRIFVFVFSVLLYLFYPQCFDVLEGMNFFRTFSPFHLLWGLWVYDMLMQIFPFRSGNALGSRKVFGYAFKNFSGAFSKEGLRLYMKRINKRAILVGLLWLAFTALLGLVYKSDFGVLSLIGKKEMFLCTVLFYIFDLICVLIWCPFRLMLGNKCCTTCRIFNWDHFMMFSPVLTVGGFYAGSLVALAVVCLLVWEVAVFLHPERFWEGSNEALCCKNCTDKLSTHICEKCRKTREIAPKEPAALKK